MSGARSAFLLVSSLLLGWLSPWGASAFAPDLPRVALVVIACHRPADEALLLAALAGLCEDAFSAAPLGAHGILSVLLAWLAGVLAARVNARSWPGRVALLGIALLLAAPLSSLVGRILGASLGGDRDLLGRFAVTLLCGLLCFRIGAPLRREAAS